WIRGEGAGGCVAVLLIEVFVVSADCIVGELMYEGAVCALLVPGCSEVAGGLHVDMAVGGGERAYVGVGPDVVGGELVIGRVPINFIFIDCDLLEEHLPVGHVE